MDGPASPALPLAPPSYTVSVRTLCEFAAKCGDLGFSFTPSPTAQEGISGHRSVAASRPAGYRSEVPLSLRFGELLVRGRADGHDPARGVVEEIKTFRGDLARMPANRRALHWAQANVYGWMLCSRDALASIDVALVYYDIDHERALAPLVERRTADELQRTFESLCERFIEWARAEASHRVDRDAALEALRFPHATFRRGQHALAGAVWHGARQGRTVVVEAPTGIGKTVGTLFPAMRAMPAERVDRIFFLTARGTGRALALDAAAKIRASNAGAPFRVIELTAREKSCEHPDRTCHGDSCPLARGFYDRLPAARIAARDAAVRADDALTQDALRAVAREHAVCPYHLGVEMVRWCDLVVGDYNHWFDGYPLLFALSEDEAWRTVVLVDEAHNLFERARDMYSARLQSIDVEAFRPHADAALKRPLARLVRTWNRLVADTDGDYRVCDAIPSTLLAAMQEIDAMLDAHRAESIELMPEPVARFHFAVSRLLRLAETLDVHSLFDVVVERPAGARRPVTSIGIRNLVPAPFLRPRFAAARSTVLFSATLTPHAYYADVLGLPADTVRVDIESPFEPEQLTVRIAPGISTRLKDRPRSLQPIVRLVAEQYAERPGNYLVFVSSHDYLQQLADAFAAGHPAIGCWRQARRMNEADRTTFLERFRPDSRGVGFAVLGGVFAEGVDLPGDRLVGAFVATLGLPQCDSVREEERRRHDARHGAGYEYTYLFPGIRRVVQAAGRVIRSVDDRGSVHLLDDRFLRPEVLSLLPAWWPAPQTVNAAPVRRDPTDVERDGQRALTRSARAIDSIAVS